MQTQLWHRVGGLLRAALLLGCIGHGEALALTVPSQTYALRVGDSPSSLANAVFFDGKYLWVAVENPDGSVVEKIGRNGEVLAIVPVGDDPVEMAYDGANVWVTDYVSSDVQVINQSGVVIKIFYLPKGSNPEGIAFDGNSMWTANNGANVNSVSKFDATTQTLVATYPVGLAPDGVVYDGQRVWVTNSYSNTVWTLNKDSGRQTASYSTGTFPLSIVFDGQNVWIGNGTGVNVGSLIPLKGSLTKIRASDGAALGTFTVGNHVRGLTYDGISIWACNSNDNTVSRVRVSDVALLATYPTGKAPRAVAFDGANIWVANSGENSLTILASQPIHATRATAGQPPGGTVRLNGLLAPNPITGPPAVAPVRRSRATAAALSVLVN